MNTEWFLAPEAGHFRRLERLVRHWLREHWFLVKTGGWYDPREVGFQPVFRIA